MRSLLRSVVSSDAALEVAGTAADGASALEQPRAQSPRPDSARRGDAGDGWIGHAAKSCASAGHKMPVIMCSSLTQRGASVTIEALAGGASDYVTKPAGQSGREAALRALAQDLIPKIHALTAPRQSSFLQSSPLRLRAAASFPAQPRSPLMPPLRSLQSPSRPQPISAIPTVVAIGVSTGGPAALDVLLPALPGELSAARPHRAAHAGALYAPLRRATQRPLQPARARGLRRRSGPRRNHLHRPRQLAPGSARRFARQRAAHAASHPGPARESLPPCRRCALSLRGQSLWLRRPRRRAHRHGL